MVLFGNSLFLLGIGLVLFGLARRFQLHRSGKLPYRRFFFTGPLIFVFFGIIVAIVSLYVTGEL